MYKLQFISKHVHMCLPKILHVYKFCHKLYTFLIATVGWRQKEERQEGKERQKGQEERQERKEG